MISIFFVCFLFSNKFGFLYCGQVLVEDEKAVRVMPKRREGGG